MNNAIGSRLAIPIILLGFFCFGFFQIPKAYAVDTYSAPFRMVDHSQNGVGYAYAPSIVYENGVYHVFFCSVGSNGAWDYIRYIKSTDGGQTWSTPVIKLTAQPFTGANLAACDPSVIYYQGYYYMYYSSADENPSGHAETVIQIARSAKIDGPYLTYTQSGQWVANPDSSDPPKEIIRPQHIGSTDDSEYGAGQSTEVIYNNKIRIYYTDTSLNPTHQPDIYMMDSDNPFVWDITTVKKVNFNASPEWHNTNDVRYDDNLSRFVMYYKADPGVNTVLRYTYSMDGLNWDNDYQLLDAADFPNWASNTGFSSDRTGHLVEGSPILFATAATADINSQTETWAAWDLFGMWVPLRPSNLNNKPVGFLDAISTDGNALGWAYDPDHSSANSAVHFYLCDPNIFPFQFLGAAFTSILRTDVNSASNITGTHGFTFTIPNSVRDGQNHKLCAYGIDSDDSNINTYLVGNPKDFSFQPTVVPTPTPTPTPTAASSTPIVGDLNLDHIINSLDWSIMNSKWLTGDTSSDVNHDGIVNSIDFSLMNANWLKTW